MSDHGTATNPISQSSPASNYQAHQEEIDAAIRRVLDSGTYVLGQEVKAFETEFARYLGLGNGVAVASGTDAIELCLRALGIGPGDAVFTVSHTAVATVAAIERSGAYPVLVDVEPDTYTLDPARLQESLERISLPSGIRARAVIPVHLYGHPADMPAIVDIADRSGLVIVEDCAQSTGALLHGRMTGTWGHASAFSFYPTKNLGALGDGGLIATDDPNLAARARELRQYGWRERHVSSIPGVNSRLDELQAAILRTKLPHLSAENGRRREIAGRYSDRLVSRSLTLPVTRPGVLHVFHQYVVRMPNRERLVNRLRRAGVGVAIHYPVPVHQQPAYAGRVATPATVEVTERIAGQVLSLPMYPELNNAAIERVVHEFNAWQSDRAFGRAE